MGFFDALDDTFGGGTALGAIEGFEERQYELGLIQEEKNKKLEQQLKSAAVGLGTTVSKRKAFDEQVSTFAAALDNDPSLKNKLKDIGQDGIRALARSALNTRYAEGGASGSKFRVSELIRQVKRTEKSVLDEQFSVSPDTSPKEDKKEDSTRSGGLLGNFANILSPTRAGEQQRSVMRQEFAKAFPDATKEELDNAINSYGANAGSTNELETGTPFSVGVLLNPTGQKNYQELIQGKIRVKTQADQVNGQQNLVAEQQGDTVRDVMNDRITKDDYTQGESDKLLEDADNLYEYLKRRNRNPAITDSEIKNTMIKEKIVSIDKYIEFMEANPNYSPFNSATTAPVNSATTAPVNTPPSGGWVQGSPIKTAPVKPKPLVP
jgi:hypothetical protein